MFFHVTGLVFPNAVCGLQIGHRDGTPAEERDTKRRKRSSGCTWWLGRVCQVYDKYIENKDYSYLIIEILDMSE